MNINYLSNKIIVTLIAGKGGDGIVSFYRNKYIYKGGPDGGNGGCGGNIYLITNNNINSFNSLKNKKIIKSFDGFKGGKNNCTGKNGKHIYIKIPIGTKVTILNKKKKIYKLKKNNQIILIAKGGKNGIGNNKFKSSTNRSPNQFTKGKKGKQLNVKLELIYKIDIGIIGLPNSGKSTLINQITNSKSKIQNYPFTTLYPILGKLIIKKKNTKFNIIDTPALIKGSNKNLGLGINFLKHLNKCKIILHIVEIQKNYKNIIKNIKIINNELNLYNKFIHKKEQWIIFNKSDLINKKYLYKIINKTINKIKFIKSYFIISSLKKYGLKNLSIKLYNFLKKKYKN